MDCSLLSFIRASKNKEEIGKVYALTDVGKECLQVLKGDRHEKRH